MKNIISVVDLEKIYNFNSKNSFTAVKSITFQVKRGEIFGFLGTNGAGKSTTIDILTTKSKPTKGKVEIENFDIYKDQQDIRKIIGYVCQKGGSDVHFSGLDNLILYGQLYGMDKVEAKKKSEILIEKFFLNDFIKKEVCKYSGGQKRKLELAMGLINTPKIIFLDEPTTGLDAESRVYFWNEIKKIKEEGVTIFLTTHYLEEADNLCDTVAIMDKGVLVCMDSAENLKNQIGNNYLKFEVKEESLYKEIIENFQNLEFIKEIKKIDNFLYLFLNQKKSNSQILKESFEILIKKNINLESINLYKPSLDEVFLSKTGGFLKNN
jgi:ABC-2 type transport system ATP-binding protein